MPFKVRVFEVKKPAPGLLVAEPPPPREVSPFPLKATEPDAAKREARARFAQESREVRSINVSADAPDTLVAYVFEKPGAVPAKRVGG